MTDETIDETADAMTDQWTTDRWGNVIDAEHRLVACVFDGRPSGSGESSPEERAETERRATLLAGAPELYRALAACWAVLTDQPGRLGYAQAVAVAEAALRRAEGEAVPHVVA